MTHCLVENPAVVLDELRERYANEASPIPVDFRQIVPHLRDDAGLNNLHTYPAKLLRHIPQFFLAIPELARPGQLVLDPFCGSGTVLLEARLAKLQACGADSNPLARLIAEVKTTPIERGRMNRGIRRLLARIPAKSQIDPPEVVNVDYWFYPHVKRDLLRILEAVRATRSDDLRRFFSVVFSRCVRRVSLADPRVPVPVRLRPSRYPSTHPLRSKLEARLRRLRVISVERVFREALADSAERLTKLSGLLSDPPGIVHISEDARNLRLDNGSHRPAASVDFVITSPPYVGAQKYIRSCSLSLNWLGLCTPGEFRQLEDLNIGREHYPQASYQNSLHTRIDGVDILLDRVRQDNPLRAHIAATYLIELQDAFREIARVMKPGAYMVLVVGNNLVGSRQFETTRYAREILEKLGLQSILVLADEIRSRGLLTKRHHTAGMIHREHVSIYQKGVP